MSKDIQSPRDYREGDTFNRDTQGWKALVQDYALECGLDPVVMLAEFNRWYGRELEEAREEGAEANQESVQASMAYTIFTGPHEVTRSYDEAQDRLNELATQGIDATVVLTGYDAEEGEALGLSVVTETITTLRASQRGRIGGF